MKNRILPLSVGLGTAFGVIFSNVPLGVAIGAALGVILKSIDHKEESFNLAWLHKVRLLSIKRR